MIEYVKIVYDREPCQKCEGQTMSIFFGHDMIERRCIKCDDRGTNIRSTCIEEKLGRMMDKWERKMKEKLDDD